MVCAGVLIITAVQECVFAADEIGDSVDVDDVVAVGIVDSFGCHLELVGFIGWLIDGSEDHDERVNEVV